MTFASNELRPVLFKLLVGTHVPDDQQTYHEESETVANLQAAYDKFMDSGMSLGSLQRYFAENGPDGFDVLSWIESKVESGEYHPDSLVDDPNDDLEPNEDLGPNVIPLR